ncbi:MAG: 23S rRNA (adenine(2503)-C(2))-methyltransferase RlmN [Lachnospiraceae bacterium]|jgi:23S rRNA (adenine2503-C2)-methyltransferase|nr:23S rRNA (adenine(2503)-C(2))-methyltransferase RlmN [Lachnospiraceae bacterium]
MEKTDIKSLYFSELEQMLGEMGEKPFRAGQIFGWLHQKLVTDFEQMSNLSKELRKKLLDQCRLTVLEPSQVKVSQIDGTCKYLFRLADGNVIESVWMKYQHGCSVCISSQVGCRMGCRFCASTIDGLARNLTASEMLEQVYRIQELKGERISHIVIMGSGEPFDNYDQVIRFLKLVSHQQGLHISLRNITVSTCGIVPGIRRFGEEGLPVTLALSLHAPNDEVRRTLMPVANRYSLREILAACQEYFEKTGRRVTFEYSLVKGVNDNSGEAKALVRLLRNMHGHVNLIPVNPVKERDFERSDKKAIQEFKGILEKEGIAVTVRREMGRDIQGACGQLRRSFLEGG